MKRSEERILTTHVGSLVRPVKVRERMAAMEAGVDHDEAAFEKTLTEEVANVVKHQAEVGVDVVSDGEFGKAGWTRYLCERLGGLETRPLKPGEQPTLGIALDREAQLFPGFYEAYKSIMRIDWLPPDQTRTPIGRPAGDGSQPEGAGNQMWECNGPLTYTGGDAIRRDIANFKAALEKVDVAEGFLPVAAPMSARGLWANAYYDDEDELLVALTDALKEEYTAIIDAGLMIQVDDAFLAHEYDRLTTLMDEAEVRKRCQRFIDLTNYALEGIPEEKIRYHVCWGSWNAPHTTDIPLATLADFILQVNAGAYSLEGANPRHGHEWMVWKDRKFPDGKILIPGVITHSTNVVEHPELIAWRISNYAGVVGKENVIAGSDCGFAQSHNVVRCHPEVQWAKLACLAQGAKLATERLW